MRIHTKKLRLNPNVDLQILASATIGMSGADLANLCNEAALTAARHNHQMITMADFEEAQDQIRLGAAQPRLNPSRRAPSHRLPRVRPRDGRLANAGGGSGAQGHDRAARPGSGLDRAASRPGTTQPSLSYLKARLDVMLGGRTAEEIVFDEITTGAENDLVEATRLARRMITRWGMGKLGLVAFKGDEQQPFLGYEVSQGRDYSEATAARIDQEVLRAIEEAHEEARRRSTDNRDKLDQLVDALLREETVSAEELNRILGPRPQLTPGQDGRGKVVRQE